MSPKLFSQRFLCLGVLESCLALVHFFLLAAGTIPVVRTHLCMTLLEHIREDTPDHDIFLIICAYADALTVIPALVQLSELAVFSCAFSHFLARIRFCDLVLYTLRIYSDSRCYKVYIQVI